jgi:hypothetical protein
MYGNQWARLLAYVTGLVNQELLLQNEHLAAENRILRAHLPARLHLSDPERCTLADISQRYSPVSLRYAFRIWFERANCQNKSPLAERNLATVVVLVC